MKMGWRGGFGGRKGWFGPWPGRGPFSFLPPWQRPGFGGWVNPRFGPGMGFGFGRGLGRIFGRGACWWLFGPGMFGAYGSPGFFGYQSYGLGGPFGYSYPPYLGASPYAYRRYPLVYPGTVPTYGYPY